MNKEEICYTIDASRIKGTVKKVFYPTSKEEIQKIIRENADDIVPRGSGTHVTGGTVADNSVVVEMRGLNKIIAVDAARKTVHVEAGITLKELNERLKQMGMEFPICFNEQSTIGSMIATNCIGEKSMRYGSMKDWIEKVEFIDGKGGFVSAGKADFAEVCGMEGTTGIITSALLKYVPLTEHTASILQSDSLSEILSTSRRLKADSEIISLKFYSKKVSAMLGFPQQYHVIVFFNSLRGKIKGNELSTLLAMTKKEYYYLHKNSYYQSEDVKLFFDKLGDYLSSIETLDVPCIGDLGMGIINSFFKTEEVEKMKTVSTLNIKSGGKKGRYPIGIQRKYLLDDLEKKIFLRIKKRHDPIGKMNKGKLFDYMPESLHEEIKKIGTDVDKEKNIEESAVQEAVVTKTERMLEDKNFVVKVEIQREEKEKQPSVGINSNSVPLVKKEFEKPTERKTSPAELTAIHNIMFNRGTTREPAGKVTLADNLERTAESKDKKAERDLITSIMTNKFIVKDRNFQEKISAFPNKSRRKEENSVLDYTKEEKKEEKK